MPSQTKEYPSIANFLSDFNSLRIKNGVDLKISTSSQITYPTGDGLGVSGFFTDLPRLIDLSNSACYCALS